MITSGFSSVVANQQNSCKMAAPHQLACGLLLVSRSRQKVTFALHAVPRKGMVSLYPRLFALIIPSACMMMMV